MQNPPSPDRTISPMADVSHAAIDEIRAVDFLEGFTFRRAGAALGVTPFGMSIIDMPPETTDYPAHDHASQGPGNPPAHQLGQEEVYIALGGSGDVEINGHRYPLDRRAHHPSRADRPAQDPARARWPPAAGNQRKAREGLRSRGHPLTPPRGQRQHQASGRCVEGKASASDLRSESGSSSARLGCARGVPIFDELSTRRARELLDMCALCRSSSRCECRVRPGAESSARCGACDRATAWFPRLSLGGRSGRRARRTRRWRG